MKDCTDCEENDVVAVLIEALSFERHKVLLFAESNEGAPLVEIILASILCSDAAEP